MSDTKAQSSSSTIVRSPTKTYRAPEKPITELLTQIATLTDKQSLITLHFPVTKDVLASLRSLNLNKRKFFEEYLDTKGRILTKNNFWLRRRWNFDGSFLEWSLKWPKDNSGFVKYTDYYYLTYEESRDPKRILERINQLLDKTAPIRSLQAFSESVLFQVVRHEIRRGDIFIYIDEAMFDKDDFYSVGAIQGREREFTIPEEVPERFFAEDLLLGPVHSKIVEFLFTKKKDFYKELGAKVVPELDYSSEAFHNKAPILAAADDFNPPQQSFADTYGQWLVNSELEREEEAGEDDYLDSLLETASKITEYKVWRDGQIVSVPIDK